MTQQTKMADSPFPPRTQFYIDSFTLFFLSFIGGLALSRLLYEGLFPQMLGLARPLIVLPFSTLIAFIIWAIWLTFNKANNVHPLTLSPLLLNLLWLLNPTVDLVRSRLFFGAAVWLTAVLILVNRDWRLEKENFQSPISNLQYFDIAQPKPQIINRWKWLSIILVIAALLPIYLLTMSSTVGAADIFEFQVVTPQLGIVHPTGYPLYLLLGKLFTLLPWGSLAWRLNLASLLFGLAAVSLLTMLLYRLVARPLPAILAATITGLTATFWSQAIVAEVYALHALVVMLALFLICEIGDWRFTVSYLPHIKKERLILLLAFIIGLGMTNHVTTIFLLPPAVLTILFTQYTKRITDNGLQTTSARFYLKLAAAFLLPLLLYAYLPLRWQAVNEEPMGLARFIDWVIAGRFQGALQLRGWLDDPTRYAIVGRLFLENWGWFNLALAGLGFVVLLWRRWQTAAIIFTLWLGVTFYALNYYVPDLAVFIIPAQLIIGVWWGIGIFAILEIGTRKSPILRYRSAHASNLQSLISVLIIIPSLLLTVTHWSTNDQSGVNHLEAWGRRVLARPLAKNGAILADSEKIAPLLYLQVAEGLRPDLDISVWPDEAAYREQVDGRLAAGQTVYLARQLPGLQSIYHLRSVGPLTEVSTQPISQSPNPSTNSGQILQFNPITLQSYQIEPSTGSSTAVTFYWQAQEPVEEVWHVYVRWTGLESSNGRHPANNFYPTNAWKENEIVSDYHVLPHPVLSAPQPVQLQVALAPPFTNPQTLAWQTVTTVDLPATTGFTSGRPYRIQIGSAVIQAAQFPDQTRPQKPLSLLVSGWGKPLRMLFKLRESDPFSLVSFHSAAEQWGSAVASSPFTLAAKVDTELENGRYQLTVSRPGQTALCGWMQPVTEACSLGEVEISGVALPEMAVNYEDKIALLTIDMPDTTLQPGGQLPVTLNWLALADLAADYTLFLQVVDTHDRIVGQIDSWPVQGTYPTSNWQPGKTISDPYTIQLSQELPPGEYRLLVGWYLLADGRRLPVLNDNGASIDDKFTFPLNRP
ncbi:MAG: DUF2723 domain-containing protein [Chloroflexi bacterium]|nr:DUF2723 domain-containing protein [Chloroflexota bacterium]